MIYLLLSTTPESPVALTTNSLQHHRFIRLRRMVSMLGNRVYLIQGQGDPYQLPQYSRICPSCHQGEQIH